MNNPIQSDDELTRQIYEAMQIHYLSERHDAIKSLLRTREQLAEVRGRQQMVDYYAEHMHKGYDKILPHEAVESSIAWLQKEADRLVAELARLNTKGGNRNGTNS